MAKIKLQNVRLSFPSLFKKAEFEGKETKFEATLLIDKTSQADQVAMLEKAVEDFAIQTFGEGKVPKALKRTCLIDGDTKDYDGYSNQLAFKGGNAKRITLIDRDKTAIVEDDEKLYAGCYVNAIVDFWYSNHPKGGKQILGNLYGVQFVRDGDSFEGGEVASVDDFDDVSGEDEDF